MLEPAMQLVLYLLEQNGVSETFFFILFFSSLKLQQQQLCKLES